MAVSTAHAIDINLSAGDGFGASSLNTGGNWSNGEAPTAGNDYFVDALRMRTPADGSSHTFAGDSLTIDPNGTSGYGFPGGELMYKGTGSTGVITINNLIMNGGSIAHANGTGDRFNLAGNLNMAADSVIYAKQGTINIEAAISGSATLTNPASDDFSTERSLLISSALNTFTGNMVIGSGTNAGNARLQLVDGANLNFVIGGNGINNSISGEGVAQYDGVFLFDLSGAGTTIGDSWNVASVATQSFGGTFTVGGFDSPSEGIWTSDNYRFSEATGTLEVIPEPSTYALIFGGLAMAGVLVRRRLRKA